MSSENCNLTSEQLKNHMKQLGLSSQDLSALTAIGSNTIYTYRKEGVSKKHNHIVRLVLKEEYNKRKKPNEILFEKFDEHILDVFQKNYNSYFHKIDYIYDALQIEREDDLIKLNKKLKLRREKKKA